jgi:hypothetical protein
MSDIGPKRKLQSNNASGLIGAFQAGGRGKFISRIRINGRIIRLRNNEGKTYFQSAEEAHEAYINAAIQFGINLSL